MFRSYIKLGIVCILIVLLCISCSKKDKETIKIGAALPLTGDGAVYGQFAKMAIDLAVNEINANPKRDIKVVIIYEDTKLDPKESTNAVSKMINRSFRDNCRFWPRALNRCGFSYL